MSAKSKTKWLWWVVHVVFLVVLGVVMYHTTLDAPMRSFDDNAWLRDTAVRNTFVKMFDPTVRSANPFSTTYYLPLQSALFYWMVEWFGRSARAFHVLSLGIHLSAAVLVYALIRALTKRPWVALLSGSLFVAHLGHHQSVTWVSAAVSHPWVTVFFVAVMLWWYRYLKTRTWWSYAGALICLVIGLLIRESAVIVPILMMALEAALWVKSVNARAKLPPPAKLERAETRVDQTPPLWQRALKASIKYVPFLLTLIPIIAISLYKYPNGSLKKGWGGVALGIHPVLRLLDFTTLLLYPRHQKPSIKLALAGAALGVAALVVYLARRKPLWFFAFLWMGFALAPYTISNFNPALWIMRYLYPASVGFVLLYALVMSDALNARWAKNIVAKLFLWGVFGSYAFWHIWTLYDKHH